MILVVGATGNLGGMVTRKLLKQSRPVRILARPYSNYRPLVEAGVQVVIGDLKDPGSLYRACRGIDVVITTANSATRAGMDNPRTVDLEGNHNLIDAARAAGVKQFIFVSAQNADSSSSVPFLQAQGWTEKYLRESNIPSTIIAPDLFIETWVNVVIGTAALKGQPVQIIGQGNRKHSFISISDVAAFIVAAINNHAAINQRLVLGGPDALSFREIVAIYERVLAKKIPVISIAPGEELPGLPAAVAPLLAAFDLYDSSIDMSGLSSTFEIQLTSLEEVVHRTVTGSVPA